MTGPAELPAPIPAVTPETKPYWDATAEGRLSLQRCDSCGVIVWYPKGLCPDCGSMSLSWFDASGRGTIYSFTITRRGQGAYRGVDAYVLAYVELEEGPRVMTNIVTDDLTSVVCGAPVAVEFHDTGSGPALPRFHLA